MAAGGLSTLLLATSLLGVSLAVGFLYLQQAPSSDKKKKASGEDAAPAKCPFGSGQITDEQIRSGAKCPVTGMIASLTGKSKSEPEPAAPSPAPPKSPVKSYAAAVAGNAAPSPSSSPAKQHEATMARPTASQSPKPVASVMESPKKAVESPKKKAESPQKTVASPAALPTASPLKASVESSKQPAVSPKAVETPKKVVESPKKVVESPKKVVESPKKVVESPKKVVESPKKAAESPKKESVAVSVPAAAKAPGSPKTPSPKKSTSPNGRVGGRPAAFGAFARRASNPSKAEELALTVLHEKEAVVEVGSSPVDDALSQSVESVDPEEFVQVNMTESMTLSQSVPELVDAKDAVPPPPAIPDTAAKVEKEASLSPKEGNSSPKESSSSPKESSSSPKEGAHGSTKKHKKKKGKKRH